MKEQFDVAGGGHVWSVVLDPDARPPLASWFGRGPTGRLLGPFARGGLVELAVADDVRKFGDKAATAKREGSVPEEPASAQPTSADPVGPAFLEARASADPDWRIWRIEQADGGECFIVAGPEALLPDLFPEEIFESWEEASNAIDEVPGNGPGGPR
ncbi:hypothetical protein ACFFMP_18780 [Pseudoroseomonas cervicalis]|uniref:Uncharacterized protein n=1 Tax=Pseudoroseomonas cervicalis ATCC 49957 TaxID=525371 RepID=D5RQV4_9PROT|nr:hypothetical protein [Pseudoroseomonas cervicalis]EFH10354.1 hypothetical protein HMPREF0731_3466 [Pseudoroseomonas cervicalis ATCC 49957]